MSLNGSPGASTSTTMHGSSASQNPRLRVKSTSKVRNQGQASVCAPMGLVCWRVDGHEGKDSSAIEGAGGGKGQRLQALV